MQIDLVDQEKSPCRQGIEIVVESRRRAIEQIADPRRHVLVAVAQVIQRHGAIGRVEDQRLARLVDVPERHVRKKLGEGRPNQFEKTLAFHVMQIHCPRCQWAERRVGVEQGSDRAGSDGRLFVSAYAGAAKATRCTIAGEEIASCGVRERVFERSQRLGVAIEGSGDGVATAELQVYVTLGPLFGRNGAVDAGARLARANPVRRVPTEQLRQSVAATQEQGDAAQDGALARTVFPEQQRPPAVVAVEIQLQPGDGAHVLDVDAIEEHGSGNLFGNCATWLDWSGAGRPASARAPRPSPLSRSSTRTALRRPSGPP